MAEKVPGWLLGMISTLAVSAVVGATTTLFWMGGKIATLEATQVQLIKQIDRTLTALTDLEDELDELN